MYIVAGLGNPGRNYAHTRHNAGYEALDRLAADCGIRVEKDQFRALTGSGVIEGQHVLLLKPLTFMNASGESIGAACAYYKINPEKNLIVLYDDVDLPPGQLRVRPKGRAGGHNGIKSIIAALHTETFVRVRIGVGKKPEGWDLADYVLGKFSGDEWETMEEAFRRAGEAVEKLLSEDINAVMNEFNTKIHPGD